MRGLTDFSFSYGPRILFGKGVEAEVGRQTAAPSRKATVQSALPVGVDLTDRLSEAAPQAVMRTALAGFQRLEEMARKCTERGPIGSFAKLGEKDVLAIYRLAAASAGRG